jgi:peptidoglycan hydrolase-like protein with peptidoglycan-binding domain
VSRRRRLLAGAPVLVAATVAGAIAISGVSRSSPAAPESANTAPVERGSLSATVSLDGTLTYRARSDGSPHQVINQARGTYTKLPDVGDRVGCGDELHRVDDRPVLLLCGTVPAYRDLHAGDVGNDVRQLNANLHTLGYDAGAGVDIDPDDNAFTGNTEKALERLQEAKGAPATGALATADAVFLPEPVRIAKVTGPLGGSAQPGAPVLDATADTLEVQADLQGSQQSEIKRGDRARITLPGNRSATGTVDRLGTVARPERAGQSPAGPNGNAGSGAAILPAYLSLDNPEQVRGLDQAPDQVHITTEGVEDALSVPVTAIVGRSGGGYAVEVVRDDGRRELSTVKLGLFDTTGGRVQIEGDLREGDHVAVPSP